MNALTYGLLFLSVILLWFPGRGRVPYWCYALLVSIIFGLIGHQLDPIAIAPIILLGVVAYYSQTNKTTLVIQLVASIVVLIVSAGLVMHQFPGFHNLIVLNQIYISQDAVPFTLYLNFDKAIVGILLLGLSGRLILNQSEWISLFKQLAIKMPVVVLVLIVAAFGLGFVRFDPKIPVCIFIWLVTNLLFVCVAEEAFFRGFIQWNLSVIMRKIEYGNYLAIFVAAILFGLAHYPGGLRYVLLATIAGIGYGWIYLSTKRIEGSILTHFGLNLTHFIFFTYPVLMSAM